MYLFWTLYPSNTLGWIEVWLNSDVRDRHPHFCQNKCRQLFPEGCPIRKAVLFSFQDTDSKYPVSKQGNPYVEFVWKKKNDQPKSRTRIKKKKKAVCVAATEALWKKIDFIDSIIHLLFLKLFFSVGWRDEKWLGWKRTLFILLAAK